MRHSDVEAFSITVEDAVLDDLQARLALTRWPGELPNSLWDYGAELSYMSTLVDYWRTEYDWRAQES